MAKETATRSKPEKAQRIPAKDAAIAAAAYFTEVTGYKSGVTVEEIELTEDGGTWLVTLGYVSEDVTQPIPFHITFPRQCMAYKMFAVNAVTGEVTSMKIRKV